MDHRLKPTALLVLFLVIGFCHYNRCSAESSIVVGPVSTSAFETSVVHLTCLAYIDDGFEGKILWLKDFEVVADGNEIVNGNGLENIEVNSTFEGHDLWSELFITDVTRRHNGIYDCQLRVYTALNPGQIISSPSYLCTLRVFYLPTPICPDQAPSFLLNEEVSILCHSDPGEKTATLEWLLDGQVTAHKTFSDLETNHTLYYKFVTLAAHQHKTFECRTASESFVMPNTCEFGPIDINLNISLNPISTTGDSIIFECTTNGNGDIEYTFYQDDVLATSGVTGNLFQVIVNEYDTVITCQAVDSNSISGSIIITWPGRSNTVSDMKSEPSIELVPTVMTTSVTPTITPSITTPSLISPPMAVAKDNNVGVAVGSSCAAIVLVVCLVIIVCLLVRRKRKHKPTSANEDLFLEEAFDRKKSLNVSFRKIQKRQSKQNNNDLTNTEDVNDDNVQFLSERDIDSSSGTGVMPDVITSANQNNLAYSNNEENPKSASDQDAVGEEHRSKNGESNKDALCLESHTNLQTKNIDDSTTEHEIHPEMPLNASTVSNRLDSLIKDTHSVQESDKHQRLSAKYPPRNYPQEVTRPLHNAAKQNDSNSVVLKEKNIDVEESVKTQANNKSSLAKTSSNRKLNTKKHSRHTDTDRDTLTNSSKPNDDTFDGSNFDEPPKEILPFIGQNAQSFSTSIEEYKRQLSHNSNKRVDSAPTAGHTSKPIGTNPHVRSVSVNTTAGRMTGKGVVNPSHKHNISQTHERRSHRGEQNVVWNTSAKSKADDRPQNQLTVTRNKHASGRSHWDEPKSTRPSNRMQPTVKQSKSLRSNDHRDAMLHPIPPAGSAGSTSHVVRNPGAKKSR